ncbi:MAG: M13 family metallopeptidase [Prevotellaceae bacterium]|jgi:putative endopeptidase|nr:M13 family metallopeptidase [Prevotellaceae bacterium]
MISLGSCSTGHRGSGIDLTNLDTAVNPRQDFYAYACGGWIRKNPLKPEYARYGAFDQLRENNQQQLNDLIDELSKGKNPQGSVQQKIADLYNVGMDEATLNEQGKSPIQDELQAIAAIANRTQLAAKIVELHTQQISPFFAFFGEADFANSDMNIGWLYQGGLSLGERDYYLDEDERSKEIRAKFVEHIAAMFALSGYDQMSGVSAAALAQQVFDLETRLAKASMDKHTQRLPEKIYNKMPVEKLKKLAPAFDWAAFFAAAGLSDMQELNVSQPSFIKEASDILKKTELDKLKPYLAWTYVNAAASYLSDDFVTQNFEFYGKVLSGREEMRPRWKRTVDVVNSALGEAVGQAYVAKYFPATSKERMVALVKNLQVALAERINGVAWMTDTTKAKALEKLATFHVKIGYPNKWRDYSKLEVKKDCYWKNILRSNKFDFEYLMSEVNKPLDKEKWAMFPQTVNAYYNPTTNEICFPAGILQPPFFDKDADDAVNYGAIGVVIGHEMTHGFDDQGRKYDAKGNLRDWWTATDSKQFEERAQALVEHFNNIEVLPGLNADGKFTLGENIADFGGLQVSYAALKKALDGKQAKKIDGFTPEQRFFIAYATLWASNIRDKEIERLTKIDVHSLGEWRVNGVLPHVEAFVQTFGIQPGDAMYLDPQKRANIW